MTGASSTELAIIGGSIGRFCVQQPDKSIIFWLGLKSLYNPRGYLLVRHLKDANAGTPTQL